MKKITVTALALTMAMGGFAQKKNVSMAEGCLYEQPVNFAEGKTLIEAAMKNPETANWSKTYYIAGQIYYKQFYDGAMKKQGQMQYSQDEMSQALLNCVNAYVKCGDLDQKPDAKGKIKPKYTKDVVKGLNDCANDLLREGVDFQKNEKREMAVKMFEAYINLADQDIMKSENLKGNETYNQVKYNIVTSAATVPSLRQTMIKNMIDLKNAKYEEERMYEWLSSTYGEEKQYDKMLQVLDEGIKKYPSNKYLIGNMINYYLSNDKEQEATQYLDAAIQKDPNNAQYYAIKGEMLLKKKQYDAAIENLTKATQLDPNDFNAQFECGMAYEKKGEELIDAASKIKDAKKYTAQKNKATEEFKKSLPYLEKARQLDGDHEQNLRFLRSVYYKLSMNKNYEEINAVIKAKFGN